VGIGSTGYKIVFVLHLLSVIVGFGTVMLNGIRGAEAKKRPGPGGLAIGESGFRVNKVAEYFIYAVPLFGLGLVGMSDGAYEFSQLWVGLSLLLYVIGIAVSHAVLIPAEKRMNVLAAELVAAGPPPAGAAAGGPPPQVVEMEGLEKKLAGAGTFLNVLVVVVVALMVFKPGI
jgi:uncharacterized membrane protein